MRTMWHTLSTTAAWLSRNQPQPTIPKWAIGVVVATPVAAAIQGALLLQQFRKEHGDAPVPITPSQGLVVVSSDPPDSSDDVVVSTSSPPLRLLVVGDSLAAGVGTSMSGTPILPESIAKALSQASRGRAVHWTCIGTPGASSTQIIHDLTCYDETHPRGEPSLLLQTWVEWEAATRRAQTWFEEKKRLQEEAMEQEASSNAAESAESENRVKRWFQRIRNDAKELQQVLSTKDKELERKLLARRQLSRRKTAFNPDTMAQYDIAIVFTGLNDMKDAFLPFMMQGENASATKEAKSKSESNPESDFKSQFARIIRALQTTMKLNLPKEWDTKDASLMNENSNEDHPREAATGVNAEGPSKDGPNNPMVVFPAMVTSPLPIFHHAPLSWFLVPLVRRMDHNKKLLAERYGGLVLYVEPPTISDVRAFEAGRGVIYAKQQGEQVLFRLTDVTQRAQEKVKELMRKHYKKKEEEAHPPEEEDSRRRDAFEQSCHDHHVDSSSKPGSTLVAADNVHPNDAGYDFWGRHIAESIVKEWESRSESFYADR